MLDGIVESLCKGGSGNILFIFLILLLLCSCGEGNFGFFDNNIFSIFLLLFLFSDIF